MGNKVKASTKKFVKNKLAGAIKKRREKQRHAVPVRAVVPRREESKLAKHTQKEEEEKEEDNDNKDQQGFEDFLEQELQDFEVDEEEEEEEEEEQLEEDDDQDDDDDDDLQVFFYYFFFVMTLFIMSRFTGTAQCRASATSRH